MITTVRRSLRMVDAWTRHRIWISAALSVVISVMESAAFGLLYVLLNTLSDSSFNPTERYGWLRAVLGRTSRHDALRDLSIAVIALLLVKSICSAAITAWQASLMSQTEARLASRLFTDYLNQDYLFHVQRNSASLVRNLLWNVGTMSLQVIGSLVTMTSDGLLLLGTFATIAIVDPALAGGIVVYIAIVVIVYLKVISRFILRAATRDQQVGEQVIQSMNEAFAGVKAVQVFDVSDDVSRRYREQRAQLASVRTFLYFMQRLPQYYLEICLVLGIAVAGSTLLQGGAHEGTGVLGILVAAALRSLPTVNRLLNSFNQIRAAGPAVANLAAIGDAGAASSESAHAAIDRVELPPLSEEIAIRGVRFTYPTNRGAPALAGVDIAIPTGMSVGIVGPSGSGKTTLVDTVLGLLVPTGGDVAIDGVPLNADNLGAWRRQVGYVPQETYLLDAGIRENVAFFRPVTEAAVWAALESAQLGDFVRSLPDGLDTRVGERGAQLSGGQRQRLGIARALVSDPRVLVLDEATSALDMPTERAFAETVLALHGKVTQIIIAHRIATVQACDEIVVMRDGVIAERGSYEELVRRGTHLSALIGTPSG